MLILLPFGQWQDADHRPVITALRFLNRVASLFFVTAFVSYLRLWRRVTSVFSGRHKLEARLTKAAVVALWVLVPLFEVLNQLFRSGDVKFCGEEQESVWYDVGNVFFALVNLLLVLSLVGVVRTLARFARQVQNAHTKRTLQTAQALSVLFGLCFALRVVCFLYRPMTCTYFAPQASALLYPWCFYLVPELLPDLAMMSVLVPKPMTRDGRAASSAPKPAALDDGPLVGFVGGGGRIKASVEVEEERVCKPQDLYTV